jgi:hypothetical protein
MDLRDMQPQLLEGFDNGVDVDGTGRLNGGGSPCQLPL